MIDNPAQLGSLREFTDVAGFKAKVFVKVDTGYHRAGLIPESPEFKQLMTIISRESGFQNYAELQGFYSHASQSYGGDSAVAAMKILRDEIEGLVEATKIYNDLGGGGRKLTLSMGATPTATSVQNILKRSEGSASSEEAAMAGTLKKYIEFVNADHIFELHAGVYPFLDLQQVATQASPSAAGISSEQNLSVKDIALTILAEVVSIYKGRENPEALVAAGSLALGREPCKSYSGWGVVSSWEITPSASNVRSGWQVGRISQEHGVLTRDPTAGRDVSELWIGQKVRIWPNHSCIAGAGYGWYLIVDSASTKDKQNEIVDVWPRWRGW